MSGHSKWAGIKHHKAAIDAQRGKMFSKIANEITVAVRTGGKDINSNARLRLVIDKARSCNMPNENVKRAIQRGTGELGGAVVEEIIYEGYGPGGIAILVEVMTDNRNRITADIRRIFNRSGGNLGEAGCVSWMFNKKGCIGIDKESVNEEILFTVATEVGAEDFKVEDEIYEIITLPDNFEEIKSEIINRGFTPKYAEITMLPQTYIQVDTKTGQQLLKLVEALENEDDVQNVYANFDIPDEIVR